MTVTKEKAELLQKWADVNKMCVGTEVNPYNCIKFNGNINNWDYVFDNQIDNYDFAIAIVENRPVFVGDELYWSNYNKKYKVKGISDDGWFRTYEDGTFHITGASWNQPKKTITINGKEFVAPSNKCQYGWNLDLVQYGWDNKQDAEAVEQELIKILEGK